VGRSNGLQSDWPLALRPLNSVLCQFWWALPTLRLQDELAGVIGISLLARGAFV
jgi:hypothetical protein